MNKKLRRVSCTISIVMCTIILLCSLAGLALVLCKNILSFSDMQKFFYIAVAEVFMPIELFVKGKLGTFSDAVFTPIAVSTLIVVIVLCLFLLRDLIKVKKPYQKNKFYTVSLLITLFIILGYFIFSLVIVNTNLTGVTKYLSAIAKEDFIVNIIKIKANVLPAIYVLVSLLSIVAVILTIEREPKLISVKNSLDGMGFYASDYEEAEKEVKEAKKQSDSLEQDAPVVDVTENGKSKVLLEKIMKLNELKDEGQISSVEYTRLRQKLIRRYKK